MPESTATSKYVRFNIPGDAHALSFACFRNRRFLNYSLTRKYFIEALSAARKKHNFHIWAYVIMPEHAHLLIFPRNESYSISDILQSIKQPVARKAIRFLRQNRPEVLRLMETGEKHHPYRFWQDGGGYDRNIRDHDELVRFVEYAHDNPVKRGLVEKPEDWYWSSAREWISGEHGPIRVDKESFPVM